MELARPWHAMDRDQFRWLGVEIVSQCVELLMPMRDAVPRSQPIHLGPLVYTGGKPMTGE